jgi:hypothetical protein
MSRSWAIAPQLLRLGAVHLTVPNDFVMPAKAGTRRWLLDRPVKPGDDKRGQGVHASRQRHRVGLIVALASCREEWNNASHAKPME